MEEEAIAAAGIDYSAQERELDIAEEVVILEVNNS